MFVYKAASIGKRPRRSRTYPEARVCATEGCTTQLSTYNNDEFCFIHRKRKTPRLRGHKPS